MNVVIIGLGYVGLPLAQEAVRVGLNVTGLDIRQSTVDGLNAGRSHVDDLTDADIAAMVAGGFRAATDVAGITPLPDVTVICVPTPLSESDGPDLTAVKSATETAAKLLKPGALVVLESTTYPGTTDEIVRPMLEKASGLTVGIDFHLAFSPERIDPGNERYGMRNTPKVVGGITPACTDAAAAFYGQVCDTVVKAKSAREAEMAKLLENTYRHVNIALVNEMAIFCHELGIDLWDSIRCAATKPFGFQAFYPGPGVGGHCIPIDPNYLSYKVRAELKHPFRFVELAQEINSRMPGYVVDRAAELLNTDAKPLNGAKVLLLGVTYKNDIADQRESPARPIARKLLQRGALLSYHDPYVDGWQVDGKDIRRAQSPAEQADLTILLQAHAQYDLDSIAAKCPPAVRHPWQDFRRLRLPAVSDKGAVNVHVVVCTVVHHPADARIFYREIQALLDAGHDVTYIAPHGESAAAVRDENQGQRQDQANSERGRGNLRLVTIPRASGRRRAGALRAARTAMAEQAAGADLLLVHDPELLLVLPPKDKRPPTVWDVHEDTAAALTTKAWLPDWLRPVAAGGVQAGRAAGRAPPAPDPGRARLQRPFRGRAPGGTQHDVRPGGGGAAVRTAPRRLRRLDFPGPRLGRDGGARPPAASRTASRSS